MGNMAYTLHIPSRNQGPASVPFHSPAEIQVQESVSFRIPDWNPGVSFEIQELKPVVQVEVSIEEKKRNVSNV